MIKELFFLKHAPKTATDDELKAIELKIKCRFPPSFVEFCSRWNGGLPTEDNDFYAVPTTFEEFCGEYGIDTNSILIATLFGATDIEKWNVAQNYTLLNDEADFGIVPIASDLMGNWVVIKSAEPEGFVYWQDSEIWETSTNPGPRYRVGPHLFPIANDLESFYNSLTRDPELKDE